MASIESSRVSSPLNQLCDSCKTFWKNATCLSCPSEGLSQSGEMVPLMPQHILHSKDRRQILSASLSGCHFCSILVGSIAGCTGDHADQLFFSESGPVFISIDHLDETLGTFLLTLFPCEQREINTHDLILNNYSLRLSPDHVADQDINKSPGSSLQHCTFSEPAADFIKSWIQSCQNDHVLCGDDHFTLIHGSAEPPRPRRLLDVLAFEDRDKIQLVATQSLPIVDYCALSYSWGFSKPFVMTSFNLEEFQREIQVKDLPRTIRDAVEVVRGIGFRYLWIDALCIMQNGKESAIASEDWYDQVNKLHDIFGNSIVTIAASESFDGEQGIIKSRSPLNQIICKLFPATGLCYEVVPPCTPYCLHHPFDNAQYHLDTRAWVFQERILSRRTIHFTRNFIHLECRTELKCETERQADACHHNGAVPKADYQALFSALSMGELPEFAANFFLGFWHELVRKYSVTNLCRREDLLVAIAGLAIRIQKQAALTWSFGLWREHLIREMMWYIRGGLGEPCRERAPSWSWASIELNGPRIIYEPSPPQAIDATVIFLPGISEFKPQPPLNKVNRRYSITVRGYVKSGAPILTRYGPKLAAVHPLCRGLGSVHLKCPFHPDVELPDDTELFCLLIARNWASPSGTNGIGLAGMETGIVLTPVEKHQGAFRRVGYFHHIHRLQTETEPNIPTLPPAFFDDVSVAQEVEII